MRDGIAETYLLNSRNLKFYKKNKKAHQTHYRENIVKLTKYAYTTYANLEKFDLPKVDENLIKMKSFADVILSRESVRDYSDKPITLKELSTLLFYSAGVKRMEPTRKRTAPSGGNLNSVDLYFFNTNIKDLPKGFYFYDFMVHKIILIEKGNFKEKISEEILYQPELSDAAILFIFISKFERLRSKYGPRALRITHIDCGALYQNIHIVAESMNFGSCAIGGVIETEIEKILDIDGVDNFVLLAQTVGNKK